MITISKTTALGIATLDGEAVWRAARADGIQGINARVVAINIPGASAISQVGTFLSVPPVACGGSPIPTHFPSYVRTDAVLDPSRILVGSQSNFGAPRAIGVGQEGSFLSIDPNGPDILKVPPNFASSGTQASTLGGAVQIFSANSPNWLNGVNNNIATNGILPNTAQYAGVSNPLGLSNNYAFGRLWPANAPFGDSGMGSSSILDPTGLPLASPTKPLLHAPNALIGGVYVGNLTDRDVVTMPAQPQVIPGALNTGAVGTALLGPSPDGTCKAVFAVVTADGAIVQEHTLKGLDGLAPAGTVKPLQGQSWDPPANNVEPRLGVLMNPYVLPGAPSGTVLQLFVSEPFNDTIAVINLVVVVSNADPAQVVFGLNSVNPVTRISSPELNMPVDLAPTPINQGDPMWASNTALDDNSDFYVANRGNNTIVRMHRDGTVVAVRRVTFEPGPLNNASLNGIATSSDDSKIYVTFTRPGHSAYQGGVVEVPAFPMNSRQAGTP
jgi:hypothetical protein